MIDIIFKENNTKKSVPYGTTLSELVEKEQITLSFPVLGALVNNKVRDLNFKIHKPSTISFFDITSPYGHDMYARSLFFILYKSVNDVLPGVTLNILHSISGGKYCELENAPLPITTAVVDKIRNRMQEIINRNIPFERTEVITAEAVNLFKEKGLDDKYALLKNRNRIYTSVYRLDDTINYYYGSLLPSTGYITLFGIDVYEKGLLLKIPSAKRPSVLSKTYKLPKLFSVYEKDKTMIKTFGIPYVSDLNRFIENNYAQEMILVTEAYHEKMLANIADEIHERKSKIILLSGPSSSGKTTTCKRLAVQMSVLGYHPVQISVDDFFVEREQTPRDENGNFDFESLDAIDLKLFNEVLFDLTNGKEVQLPVFDFTQGKKIWNNNKIQLHNNSVMLIEGIHCLNPKLTEQIEDSLKYKIFVSALTCISIDRQNPIPTTDNRLIRRIIRDYNYRGYSALETLHRWQSVRNGEDKNIFPFQEQADIMFNTSLICEMGVLKQYAVPLLQGVPETEPEFAEATRLLKFLSYFKPIPENTIPGTSILREFVGGSKFKY